MIRVNDFKTYAESFVSRITGLKKAIVVSNEAQLIKYLDRLKKSEFPLLVAVLPSADSTVRDNDNVKENSICLIYVLSKIDATSETYDSFIADMDSTQQLLSDVKNLMHQDKVSCGTTYHDLVKRLQCDKMHTDPEYNYLGCNGWSLSFIIENIGF